MPNRELREGLLSSEAMAALTAEEERLFIRLVACADDFGRFDARPMIVKSRAFPLADMMPGVTLAAIETWLNALHHKRLIRLYEVTGKPFLVVERWHQRVRASASKYPAPPGECRTDDGQMPDRCPADDRQPLSSASEERITRNEERGTRSEGSARPRANRSHKSPIPDGFAVSDAVKRWAQQHGFDPQAHLGPFRAKCLANGYRYVDWDAAFMEAIRADWAGLNGRAGGRPGSAAERNASVVAQLTGRGPAPKEVVDVIAIERTAVAIGR
jgi:hypothetical protein